MTRKFLGQEYNAATNTKGLKEESRWHRFCHRFAIGLSTTVMTLSSAIIIFCLIFIMSPVDGTSMMMTLNATGANTDTVLVYRLGEAKCGDIIATKLYHQHTGNSVTYFPEQDKNGNFTYIIKRVIATAGQTLSVTRDFNPATGEYEYTIYRDGEKLLEDYLDPVVGHPTAPNFARLYNVLNHPNSIDERGRKYTYHWRATDYDACVKDGVLTVPEGYWFIMGDNRGGGEDEHSDWVRSWDSSSFGPQPVENFVGLEIDQVEERTNMPRYLWNKIVYYIFFGWAWQK